MGVGIVSAHNQVREKQREEGDISLSLRKRGTTQGMRRVTRRLTDTNREESVLSSFVKSHWFASSVTCALLLCGRQRCALHMEGTVCDTGSVASDPDSPCLCSFGRQNCTETGLLDFSSLEDDERFLISSRARRDGRNITKICRYHYDMYVRDYPQTAASKNCVNPFSSHRKKVKGTKNINVNLARRAASLSLIPGDRLCVTCYKQCLKLEEEVVPAPQGAVASSGSSTNDDEPLALLNASLQVLGETPVKKKRSMPQRETYAKKKVMKIQTRAKSIISKGLGVNLAGDSTEKTAMARDYENLLYELKEKYKDEVSPARKASILTLAPASWSRQKVMDFFGAPERQVRKARELKQSTGVLAEPLPRKGKPMAEEVKTNIRNFYEEHAITYCLPGKKDVIKGHQKRIVLVNLREAYEAWKSSNPTMRAGFSTFASLRPAWCVLAGAPGTHSVCVCLYHQNLKLMLQAIGFRESYTELVRLLVCDIGKEECMLSRCARCPGVGDARQHLEDQELLSSEFWDSITFQQWFTGHHISLQTCVLSSDEFRDQLLHQLENIKFHHFVTKEQSRYLSSLKSKLPPTEAIIVLDFAENYSFIAQDAPQSFHWENTQATIHPIVAYYVSDIDGSLLHKSYAIISDCMTHDTAVVHTYIKVFLQAFLPTVEKIEKVHYFSDGAASQYKNKKNFLNLCFHSKDFEISAAWNFFATSHGKGPCDGVGGTLKRLAAKASLQRPHGEQILSPHQLFLWAQKELRDITPLWVCADVVQKERESLSSRFETAVPVPGTRKCHYFEPVSNTHVRASVTSTSTESSVFKVCRD